MSRLRWIVLVGALALGLTACGGGGKPVPRAPLPDLATAQTTTITLDPGFVKALRTLGLTLTARGNARYSKGVLSFPVNGDTQAALSLNSEANGQSVSVGAFHADPASSDVIASVDLGDLESHTSSLFFLDGRTLTAPQTGPMLEGVTVQLTQQAADLLNKTFGIKSLAGGLVVGKANINLAA